MAPRDPEIAPSVVDAFRAGDPTISAKEHEARHVGRVRAFYAAIERQDWALLDESLTDDVSISVFGGMEFPQMSAGGRESVLALLRENFESVESSTSHIETLAAQGDIVLAIARDRGTIKGSGEAYEVLFFVHFDFRDGRICRARQWVLPQGQGPA